jgi:tetratricopeptide (TPR) repeat protein
MVLNLDLDDLKKFFFEEKKKELSITDKKDQSALIPNEWEMFLEASQHGIAFFLEYAKMHFKEVRYNQILLTIHEIGRSLQNKSDSRCSEIPHNEIHFYKELIEGLYLVAKTTLEERRFKQSGDLFYILTVFCPLSFDVWLGLGMSYQFLNHPKKALEAFAKARMLEPSNCLTYLFTAEIYLEIQDLDLATKNGKEGLKLTPKNQKNITKSFEHILNVCDKAQRRKVA